MVLTASPGSEDSVSASVPARRRCRSSPAKTLVAAQYLVGRARHEGSGDHYRGQGDGIGFHLHHHDLRARRIHFAAKSCDSPDARPEPCRCADPAPARGMCRRHETLPCLQRHRWIPGRRREADSSRHRVRRPRSHPRARPARTSRRLPVPLPELPESNRQVASVSWTAFFEPHCRASRSCAGPCGATRRNASAVSANCGKGCCRVVSGREQSGTTTPERGHAGGGASDRCRRAESGGFASRSRSGVSGLVSNTSGRSIRIRGDTADDNVRVS